jgi:hypothetical protein
VNEEIGVVLRANATRIGFISLQPFKKIDAHRLSIVGDLHVSDVRNEMKFL